MAKGVQSHSGGVYDGSAQFDIMNTDPFQGPIQILSGTADVINIDSNLGNNYICTNAGALDAVTLSRVPVGNALGTGPDDGLTICFWSASAFAHKITTVALLQTGVTGGKNSVALAAFAGAGVILRAYNGLWQVIGATGVLTFA
jgi:hypothetical protein